MQVVLQKTETGVHITLHDVEVVFLEVRHPAAEELDQVRVEHDENDKEDAEAGKETETMRKEVRLARGETLITVGCGQYELGDREVGE